MAGGIPLIRAVKEGLVANRMLSLAGIVNGTCNYILTKMTDEGLDFSLVLKEAQAHGYAEADPTLDIEGIDSAHKLQILVALAFRTFVDLKHIHTEGITRVTAQDIDYARELGYRIKLLAIAKATAPDGAAGGGVEVRVHPTMIPAASPLAAVSGVFNAHLPDRRRRGRSHVLRARGGPDADRVRGAGRTSSRSPGASPTASPRSRLELPSVGPTAMPLTPMEAIRCCYYLRVMAQDRPGVLSRVAGILGEHDISIAYVIQKGRGIREAVPVVMLTHEARERDMRAALAKIDRLRDVAAATMMIRVEGGAA